MPLTVPPVTRLPLVFSTGIGSPVIIDSSTELVPSSTTPSTGILLAGADAQSVADVHVLERHVDFGAVVAQQSRGLGREP